MSDLSLQQFDDESSPVTVYKVEILIVDHDCNGIDEIKNLLENARYPNHAIYPSVLDIKSKQVQWSDSHPLNNTLTQKQCADELFAEL